LDTLGSESETETTAVAVTRGEIQNCGVEMIWIVVSPLKSRIGEMAAVAAKRVECIGEIVTAFRTINVN